MLLPDGGRIIKTHEPYLARYRRAIHLVRDPRDVAVSYFRFMQRVGKIVIRPGDDTGASFDRFVDAFIAGRIDAHGTWQTHSLTWLDAAERGASDVLLVRYEDLRADPVAGVARIGAWLGLSIDRPRAVAIAERCSIERMQQAEQEAMASNPAVFSRRARRSGVPLINAGRGAGWASVMTQEQRRRLAESFGDALARLDYPAG